MVDFHGYMKAFWLVWCFVLFVAIVARVCWPGRGRELEAQGRIPLDDDKEG